MTTQYCLGNFNLYYMTNYALELFSNYHTYVSKLEKAYVVLFVYLKFISLVSSCPNKDKLNLNFKLSKTYKCLCLFSFNQFKLYKITIFNGSISICKNQFTKMSILLILVYSILTFWGALTYLCWLLIGWILGKQ